MKKMLLIALCGISVSSFAQNLIKNPEFSTSKKVTYRSQINKAEGWSNANGGSVDLFNADACKSDVGIPNNFMGTQEFSGNYAGFTASYDDQRISLVQTVKNLDITSEKGYSKYAEYLQGELTEGLVAGQKYAFSIKVSLAEMSGRAVKGLGVYFSSEKLAHTNNKALDYTPQVVSKDFITDESGWASVTGEFVAKGGEKYFTLGAFEGSSTSKSIVTAKKENDNKRAYYYINGGSLTKVIEKDSDGDGVLDKDDACPSVAGTVKGCPDRDGDGIADKDDDCPDLAGVPEKKGCPLEEKDSDGDGVKDSKDKCPTVKGTVDGCPDRDGDGIADKDDECPDTPGIALLNGCALSKAELETIKKASEKIYFNTGSATIKAESFPELDGLAKILKDHPEVEASIEGHTDSEGNDAANLKLSKARAKSVKDYLISKGVEADHLSSEGYGETKPIADNKTAEGRAQNRRVVINTSSYRVKVNPKGK